MRWRLEDLRLFVDLIDARSFTVAAKRSRIPRSSVSRRIAELEREAGVQLIWRSTRKMRPTEIGLQFYDRCRQILDKVGEAERLLGDTSAPSGHLCITGPGVVTRPILGDCVVEYMQAYPRVTVEVLMSDRAAELRAEGLDLGISVGPVADESLVARRLGSIDMIICASPKFVARAGTPRKPQELRDVDFLGFSMNREPPVLALTKGRRRSTIRPACRLVTDDYSVIRSCALVGLGVAVLPSPFVVDHLRERSLVPVLSDWSAGTSPVNLVYAAGPAMSSKLRAFLTMLDASLRTRELPWAAA